MQVYFVLYMRTIRNYSYLYFWYIIIKFTQENNLSLISSLNWCIRKTNYSRLSQLAEELFTKFMSFLVIAMNLRSKLRKHSRSVLETAGLEVGTLLTMNHITFAHV